MASVDSAQDYFDYLISESNNGLFKKNLEHIRKACDDLEHMQVTLSNNKVARYAQKHFGHPSIHGIKKNSRHKRYLHLRKEEQKRKQKPRGRKKSANLPNDVEGCHNHIRLQEAEIKTLKVMLKEFELRLQRHTITNPICSAESIASGANTDCSIQMIHQKDAITQKTGLSPKAIISIEKLLKLGYDGDTYLEYVPVAHGEKLIISTNSVEKTVLNNSELQALRKSIKP